jgi:hypothetical protein
LAPSARKAEIVTEFLALAGADIERPWEHGQVVRVRMPRAALRSFGLPMNEDRAFEAVTADLVLGEDGLARAIRFVQ